MTDIRTHGVLVTFRRPEALRQHLERLAQQTRPLETLLVVDNDDDPDVADLIANHVSDTTDVRYLGLPGNPGPAGAIATAIKQTLQSHGDGWVVILDDDDPPPRNDTLEAMAASTASLVEADPRTGGVGLWGAGLRWTGRLRAATGDAPERVSYLPGGACPHYRISTLREAIGPDPELFFGFDDLDLGLAVGDTGATVWSSGLARSHGWTSMVEGRRTEKTVAAPTWRRYYSLRNIIIVLRRNRRPLGAAILSIVAGLAKPLINLPLNPRAASANLRVNFLAISHGWRNKTGKVLDPADPPRWLT